MTVILLSPQHAPKLACLRQRQQGVLQISCRPVSFAGRCISSISKQRLAPNTDAHQPHAHQHGATTIVLAPTVST